MYMSFQLFPILYHCYKLVLHIHVHDILDINDI